MLRIVSKYSMLKCICWLPGAALNSGQVQTQIKFKISHVMISQDKEGFLSAQQRK